MDAIDLGVTLLLGGNATVQAKRTSDNPPINQSIHRSVADVLRWIELLKQLIN